MGKKLTIEYVREAFVKEGYILLSKEYNSIFDPLEAVCSNGHNFKLSAKHLLYEKRGCKYCNNSLYFKDIVKSFEYERYKLVTTKSEYKNNKQLLKTICPKGHEYIVSYAHWSKEKGSRCKTCYFNSLKTEFNIFSATVSAEGYLLLDLEPANFDSKTRVKCKCSCGYIYTTSWNVWQSGHRCKPCAYVKLSTDNSGENSPGWRGGISLQGYCDAWADKEYKESIKQRDNNQCQNPYCYHNTDKLVIHHIDYTKTLCGPDNLITVCGSCNTRANYDREWHTEWYQIILNKKYGYKYKNQ